MDVRIKAAVLAAGLFLTTAHGQVGNNDSVLNPNLADEDELAGVTHLDAALASRIVNGRPFAGTAALDGTGGVTSTVVLLVTGRSVKDRASSPDTSSMTLPVVGTT